MHRCLQRRFTLWNGRAPTGYVAPDCRMKPLSVRSPWSLHASPPPKQRTNGKWERATCSGGSSHYCSWAAALLLLLGQIVQEEKSRSGSLHWCNSCACVLPVDVKSDSKSTEDISNQNVMHSRKYFFSFSEPFQPPPPALPTTFKHKGAITLCSTTLICTSFCWYLFSWRKSNSP